MIITFTVLYAIIFTSLANVVVLFDNTFVTASSVRDSGEELAKRIKEIVSESEIEKILKALMLGSFM